MLTRKLPSVMTNAARWQRTKLLKASIFLFSGAAIYLALFVFALATIVPQRGGAFDFTPRYVGTQVFWSGGNPYSAETTRIIQTVMFGGELPPNADQQRFVYPLYTVLPLAPLAALPLPVAIAGWMSLQLWAVLAAIGLWLVMLRWQPRPLTFAALVFLLAFALRYPVNLFLVANFSGTILLAWSCAVYLFQRQRGVAGGLVLTLAAIPPQIGAPLALVTIAAAGRVRVRAGLTYIGVMLAALYNYPQKVDHKHSSETEG